MSEILTVEKFKECIEDLAFDRWGDSELFAHDAALRLALETATQRVAKLERQRSEFDCRYAGPYAETSGVHCPLGQPCQSCQLVAAERERDDNANVILEQNKLWADRCEVAERERDEARRTVISRDEWRRHAEEQLADVLRLRFLGIEFASQYGDRALACKYDNSCDDSGREPECIPCAFRRALGLMGVN